MLHPILIHVCIHVRVKNKTKESLSYSEDFETSLPLTQSAAYKNMLSAVDISDEEEDLEEEFLQGVNSVVFEISTSKKGFSCQFTSLL